MDHLATKLSFIGGLIICLSTTFARQCYQCRDLYDPELCTHVVSCNQSAGENTCFVEEVINDQRNFGYHMGCAFQQECSNITVPAGVLGRRDLSREFDTRRLALTTCFKCCHGDLCNNVLCKDLCESDPCQHGATCHSTRLGDSFSCSCVQGYTGKLCQTDVDECASSPCQNGGSCEDRVNGFLCHCPVRFTGPRCETEVSKELICSHCEGVRAAVECNRTVVCSHEEKCFADTYNFNGQQLMRKGCRTSDFCQIYKDLVHNEGQIILPVHSHHATECSQCCDSDLCNINVCNVYQKSCAAYFAVGETKSGVYSLDLKDGLPAFKVFCDMDTQGGGWTVFQRRQDGSVDFYRGWVDYKTGFGDLTGEFWLGLDKISRLTASGMTKLHVDLETFSHNKAFANYSYFSVAPESDNYRLNISGYSGTAGDSMTMHSGIAFNTKDRDNDVHKSNCAVIRKGAWWYDNCYHSNLNGVYKNDGNAPDMDGIIWETLDGYVVSLKQSEMKMK